MIQRELQTVQVLSYAATKDAYGQTRTGTPTQRNAEMVCKEYNNKINEGAPKFDNVSYICLTKDKSINDTNELIFGGKTYYVRYVIPSNRWNQLYVEVK